MWSVLFRRLVLLLLIIPVSVSWFPDLARAQQVERWWRSGFNSDTQNRINSLGSTPVLQLQIPVLLGVAVSDLTKNFGDPRSGGRTHEGLDMLAPKGTPVASPTAAVVVSTGDGEGSGLYVRTANPGGESFVYMHLSAIAKGIERGAAVAQGDILGFVGNTGNASGGPAHLHFEIRDGGPHDPFPRLTQVFTIEEQMRGVNQAIERSNDPTLSTILVTHFRKIFEEARTRGLALPQSIIDLLNNTTIGSTKPPVPVSSGPLRLGSTGTQVVKLQQFLIQKNIGEAAARLKAAGATGYFGTITQAALVEYQLSVNIPASGIVDEKTNQLIFSLAAEGASPGDGEADALGFTRDLTLGSVGNDVRALQAFLNDQGFILAQTGPGSPGNETTGFGPLTKAALARYQAANGISATGYFGPITRKFIASQHPT